MFRYLVLVMGLCICLPIMLSAEEQKPKRPEGDLKLLQGLWKGCDRTSGGSSRHLAGRVSEFKEGFPSI